MIKTTMAMACLVMLLAGASAANATIDLYVNGKLVPMEPAIAMHHDHAYGDLRGLASAMGATVDYHPGDHYAAVTRGDKTVKINMFHARVHAGKQLVQVREMAEGLGGKVTCDEGVTRIDVSLP
jgi:hypothetical protein